MGFQNMIDEQGSLSMGYSFHCSFQLARKLILLANLLLLMD